MYLFVQLAIVGLLIGATYALVAFGIIVTYNGSGVLNFSQIAIGTFAAYTYAETADHGVNRWIALVIGLCAGGLLALVAFEFLLKQLRHSPVMSKMIATFGIELVVTGVITLIWGTNTVTIPSLFPTTSWTMKVAGNNYVLGENIVYTTVLTILIAVGLILWYRKTVVGRAIRAASVDEVSAMRLGYRPTRLGALTWTCGGALAALGAIVVAPSLGGLNSSVLSGALIAGLATALVASFESIGVALIAGMLLGVGQSVIVAYVSTPGVADSLPFLLIAVFLIVRGNAIPSRDTVSKQRLPALPPIKINWLFLVITCGAILALPFILGGFWMFILGSGLALAPVFLSLTVLTGWTGQISLAQFSIAMVGGFSVAGLLNRGWPLLVALAVVCILAFPAGVIVGWPALRVRGQSLVVLTLGIAIAIPDLLLTRLFGTAQYLVPAPRLFGKLLSIKSVALLSLGFVLLIVYCLYLIRKSRFGKSMAAVRASERAAVSVGINVRRTKLIAFGLASSLAAFGGAMWALTQGTLTASNIDPMAGLQELAVSTIQGIGSIAGGVVSSLAASFGPDFVSGPLHLAPTWFSIVSGILVILTIRVHPDGVLVGHPLKKLLGRRSDRRPGRGASPKINNTAEIGDDAKPVAPNGLLSVPSKDRHA